MSSNSGSANPDLRTLDRLVGSWGVTGEADGTVSYEWATGGFFLLQRVQLGGQEGLEVIGHEQPYGEAPSADIRSRYYGFSEGATLDYTYELTDDTLTIWLGATAPFRPAFQRSHTTAAPSYLGGDAAAQAGQQRLAQSDVP